MSLSCMELQLDQWLLTKGKSSTGESLGLGSSRRGPGEASSGGPRAPGHGCSVSSLLRKRAPFLGLVLAGQFCCRLQWRQEGPVLSPGSPGAEAGPRISTFQCLLGTVLPPARSAASSAQTSQAATSWETCCSSRSPPPSGTCSRRAGWSLWSACTG